MTFDFDPLSDPRWPELLDKHPSASPFHTARWLRALSDTYGYRPAAITTNHPNERLSAALVYCEVASWLTGRRLVSVPFSDYCDPLADDPKDLVALTKAFSDKASDRRCRYGELRFRGPNPTSAPTLEPSERFFLHVLDLRRGTESVFARFHKDCIQRKIRRAEKEGVHVRIENDLDVFFRLHLSTRRRHLLPPQPIAWFQNLSDCLGASMKTWVARHDGEPVATVVVIEHGRTLYYKYGASDARFHRLGAMPSLFWHVVQDSAGKRLDALDLGRSDLNDAGLVAFKDHLGAKRSELSYLRCSPQPLHSTRRRESLPMQVLQKACAIAPDRCLAMLGTLLYRHSA